MEILRHWAESVFLPWLASAWPSIATGAVFTFTLLLLTFYGPEDTEEGDD